MRLRSGPSAVSGVAGEALTRLRRIGRSLTASPVFSPLGWLSRRSLPWVVLTLAVAFAGIEAVRWVEFYRHATAAQSALETVEREIDFTSLDYSRAQVEVIRSRVLHAEADLESAERHVNRDPLLAVGRRVPGLQDQADGLARITRAARSSAAASLQALDVLLAYRDFEDEPGEGAIEQGMRFLESQSQSMAVVRRSLDTSKAQRAAVPGGLAGPLHTAVGELDRVQHKLDAFVTGYERATTLLPEMLGFRGPRSYLVLAQNNTELFPSGGLISNYGTVTFDAGHVSNMEFEYFGTLFRRWQQQTAHEYVAPPEPLKQYLLRDTTWALGEAGWYPDFPTTAALARSFVEKGGASAPDGTIAIDLQFIQGLLSVTGPVPLDEYGITVDATNLMEVTLAQTRDESILPEAVGKGFLSTLASKLIEKIVATPQERWLDLIQTVDRMGRERHLQLQFSDPTLQAQAVEYGFDGAVIDQSGDFLMLVDTSVRSTKLNLILEESINVDVRVQGTGVEVAVARTTANPFPSWQEGRDPRLVRALMLEGVYGSYLRLYAPPQAQLLDVRVDTRPVGAQQAGREFGKSVFARYTPVLPGETETVHFRYRSEGVVEELADGWQRYRLYVQKQPGTDAIPLHIAVQLPPGSELRSVTENGSKTRMPIATDLRVDRVIEVIFRPPNKPGD